MSDALSLNDDERAIRDGAAGDAAATAMRLVEGYAIAVGAERLLPIAQAHIDGCILTGRVSLDFVRRLADDGGRVAVPTTLNVGSVDLIHPQLVLPSREKLDPRRELMELHITLGCEPSFTCAPYLRRSRPGFGDQIAWGESNAVAYANSVIGARTNRYGDFIDLCCAVIGRAPAYGLHLDANRRAECRYRLDDDAVRAFDAEALCIALGYLVGGEAGTRVPVIEGLPPTSEDALKALGAVAASSGSIGLYHVVGQTPEAPDLASACHGEVPARVRRVTAADLRDVLAALSTADAGAHVQAVSLGTPHYSLDQLRRLHAATRGWHAADGVRVYVNTGRETWTEALDGGFGDEIEAAGIVVVLDTCVYVTSILAADVRTLMTDSGKLAHYAPGNLGVDVAFGTLADCLASASVGRVVRGA